jgi:hypothetical protein
MVDEQRQSNGLDSFDSEQKNSLSSAENPSNQIAPDGANGMNGVPIEPKAAMDKRQKIMLWALGGFALAIIVLFVLRMGSLVKIPWPKLFADEKPNQYYVEQYQADKEAEAQKTKDTDGDGLNDYDELQIYNTSPYLADSDSDGLLDKAEISVGTDPNCPKGEECFNTSGTPGSATTENSGAASTTTATTMPTAAELRQLLVASGNFTAEEAAAFTDDELVAFYEQFLAANPDLQTQADSVISDSEVTDSIVNLQKKTPAQIRQELKDLGIDDATLGKVSDEDILILYEKALSEAESTTTSQ